MKLLSPTQHRRLNEIVGFLLLSLGLVILLSLISYHTQDPSFDTAAAARPSQPCRLPGLLSLRSVLPDVRRGGVSVPAADLPALLEVDPQRGFGGRRGQDFRLDPADARSQRRALVRALSPVRRQHTHRRHAGSDAGQLPGGFAQRDRRAGGHADRDRDLRLPGLDVHPGDAGRSGWPVRRHGSRRAARPGAPGANARTSAPSKRRKQSPPPAAPPSARSQAAPANDEPESRRRRRGRAAAFGRGWPRALGDRRSAAARRIRQRGRAFAATRQPRPQPSKRFRSARWRNSAPVPRPVPRAVARQGGEPHPHAHRPGLPPAADGSAQRGPRAQSLRRAGTERHRQPHQGQVRRVQRARQRGADQSRPRGHHLRVQAGSRHEVRQDHQPPRRPLPRPARRIHPDRAHPGQAHSRHRGAEYPGAS